MKYEEFDLCGCDDDFMEDFSLTTALMGINTLLRVAPGMAKQEIVKTISELTIEKSEHGDEIVATLQEVANQIDENIAAGRKTMEQCVSEHKKKTRAAFAKCATQCIQGRKR